MATAAGGGGGAGGGGAGGGDCGGEAKVISKELPRSLGAQTRLAVFRLGIERVLREQAAA